MFNNHLSEESNKIRRNIHFMKKKQLTVILLIWLFSQQLFAVTWVMPHTGMGCVEPSNSQSDCTANVSAHQGHAMPMMQSANATDFNEGLTEGLSMLCDHCSTICQPSLTNDKLILSVTSGHLPFATPSIATPIDIFLSSLYRPPIPA